MIAIILSFFFLIAEKTPEQMGKIEAQAAKAHAKWCSLPQGKQKEVQYFKFAALVKKYNDNCRKSSYTISCPLRYDSFNCHGEK